MHFCFCLSSSPLSNEASAAVSDIKSVPYHPAMVRRLFNSLQAEGPAGALLFLKSVKCVELYVHTGGEGGPRLIYSCRANTQVLP